MPPKRKPLSAALVPSAEPIAATVVSEPVSPVTSPKRTTTKARTVQQTVYLPPAVHDQLRKIAFDERVKMHDILIEGLNLAFARRGLPRTDELA